MQRLYIIRFCILRAELYIGIESADDTAIFFNFLVAHIACVV